MALGGKPNKTMVVFTLVMEDAIHLRQLCSLLNVGYMILLSCITSESNRGG